MSARKKAVQGSCSSKSDCYTNNHSLVSPWNLGVVCYSSGLTLTNAGIANSCESEETQGNLSCAFQQLQALMIWLLFFQILSTHPVTSANQNNHFENKQIFIWTSPWWKWEESEIPMIRKVLMQLSCVASVTLRTLCMELSFGREWPVFSPPYPQLLSAAWATRSRELYPASIQKCSFFLLQGT